MNTWHISIQGQIFGPYPREEIISLIQANQAGAADLVWKEGMSHWTPVSQTAEFRRYCVSQPVERTQNANPSRTGGPNTLIRKLGELTGLGTLDGFSLKIFFSEVWRKHSQGEAEKIFDAGTLLTTPDLSKVKLSWPRPWLFSRLLFISSFLTVILYVGIFRFENDFLIPGWVFVGCFMVPFAAMIFFYEINCLKNMTLYGCISIFLTGGIFSIIVSLALFEHFYFLQSWLGAMSAGIIEETGKLGIVILISKKLKGKDWILNGMLIGAAVGCGFAAFETAGYVYSELSFAERGAPEGTMLVRALLSPFNHVVWTSLSAGAVWQVKGDRPFSLPLVFDLKFLRVFLLVVVLHMLWNSPLNIPFFENMLDFFLFRFLLGSIAWSAVFLMMQNGLAQVKSVLQSQHNHGEIR